MTSVTTPLIISLPRLRLTLYILSARAERTVDNQGRVKSV